MSDQSTSKRSVTPPKGRPTRSRHDLAPPRKVFGPVTQWTAAIVLLAVAFAVLFVVID